MRLTPVDILANWYNDETLPWSAQKAVNCLAETAEVGGTRSVAKVKGLPGHLGLVDLLTNAPIRGAEDVEGKLFIVSGTSLFEIHTDFSFTNRGNIPGVSLVSMAHNKQGGTASANELAIANGLSGYVYNTDTTALVQITDDAFPGATTFDYVDGYMSFTDPEGRFWGHSALNQATQYSSIDRYDAESAPDKIVSHIVSHREVMVFGTRTTEFFRNTGAATGTFQRVDGTEMEVGIAAPLARARLDNTVYWLGSDGYVYRLAGHSPQRVSTRPIEQAISRFNLDNAFAHTWEDRGHQVFYLTFPDGLTFGYDVASGLWHARETYGLDRWGINTTTRWNGLWVSGDYSNGKLYTMDWDTYHDAGLPLVMECQPGVTHADGNAVLCPYVELFMDTGTGANPVLTLGGDVPNSEVGILITPVQYVVTGGVGPYTFFLSSGSLPTGLSMDDEGLVTGTPTVAGPYSWVVGVMDAFGEQALLADDANITESVWAVLHSDDFSAATAHNWSAPVTTTPGSFSFNMFEVMGSRIGVGQTGVSTSYRTSTNLGGTWAGGTGTTGMRSMTSGSDRWYLGRDDGAYDFSDNGTAFTQKLQTSGTMMANDDSVYTIFSIGDQYKSTDRGDNWVASSYPFSPFKSGFVLARDPDSNLIAMGDCDDTPLSDQPRFATSEDIGSTWTVSPTLPLLPADSFISGITRSAQSWVMVTDSGRILYKLDDGAWTLNAFDATQLNDVWSDGETMYAVGNTGKLIRSLDYGVTWANVTHALGVVNFTRIRRIA